MRTTIDYGIDLGTTNSAVAVLEGTEVTVIRHGDGSEYMPSAVYIDRKDGLHVGQAAYERLEDDEENAFGEFKTQMGKPTVYTFARSGRQMRPDELSAEVLKRLKSEAAMRGRDDASAAVVTVPAAFELDQCDATKRAAQAAGFSQSPLLQEPVAAAMAFGFETKKDKVFWLVYDFGGGTFDAAIISIRDGVIQVVNHGGDNHLGGKLIDWEIVNQLLIPAALQEHELTDFRRGNPKWRSAFAKLKINAEKAKIRCSNTGAAEIRIDFLCMDDRGEPVEFWYELTQAQVSEIMEPLVLRSLNICKGALSERRLGPGDIEKVLLVGGPTQTPYLRTRLSDAKEGLGIQLDYSIDPMTVVARGAAVFSGTQRLETGSRPVAAPGQFSVDLDYKPVGSDPEPMVGGQVSSPDDRGLEGFTIEFVNNVIRPPWRSSKIGLSPEGKFTATLFAEKRPRERLPDRTARFHRRASAGRPPTTHVQDWLGHHRPPSHPCRGGRQSEQRNAGLRGKGHRAARAQAPRDAHHGRTPPGPGHRPAASRARSGRRKPAPRRPQPPYRQLDCRGPSD